MSEQRKPQAGDLIWADRSVKGLPYNHCGIYEGADYVIHFASPEGSEVNPESAIVHRTTFEHFSNGCPVKVIELENPLPVEETLRRAHSTIGDKGYNIATWNCDHFATWCKTGERRSIQVDNVKATLRETGNPLAELVCNVHDIAEMLKAPRLDTVYPQQENEIIDSIETNADMTEIIPPVLDEANDIIPDYDVIGEEIGEEPIEENELPDDGDPDDEPLPPAKKAWYEKVGGVLKGITYPISGALELLKRAAKIPILQNINFIHIGAKVRNTIDNVINGIKVFTGRMTKEEAYEERLNNETALAGQIIQQIQNQPIVQTLTQTFGKVGSVLKHVVQQAVTRVIPAPVRAAIKTGFRKVASVVATGVRSFAGKVKEKAKGFLSSVKRKLFG